MHLRDREGRMAIVIAIDKDPPVQLFKTLLKYHADAGFNFTQIPEEESKAADNTSFLEELFNRSKNLKRDVALLQSLGAIKGLGPEQLARLKLRVNQGSQDEVYSFLVSNFGLKARKMAAFIYYAVVARLTKKIGRKPHTLSDDERRKLQGPDRLGRLTEGKFREIAKYLA